MRKPTPSTIARAVAAREWPEVQRQVKIGPGVFGFTCAGHGGIVAIIGVADLPAAAVDAARAEGLTEFVVCRPGEICYTSGQSLTAPMYKRSSLEEYAAARPELPAFEVWIGEEDCDWSTILYANDALRVGALSRPGHHGYLAEGVTREDVERSACDWNPDYVEAFTGRKLTGADSSTRAREEWKADHAGDYVTDCAYGDWHDNVPEGFVGVSAKRSGDGDERYFLVPKAEYDTRHENACGSFVIDPSRHPEWIGPDAEVKFSANYEEAVA